MRVLIVFILFIVLVAALFGLRRALRRRRILSRPFPTAWRRILKINFPIYNRLPDRFKAELESCIQVFIAEKNFEGCGGLEITDEIAVTIAAQACLLLLNRKLSYYPKLSSILVYPSAFRRHVQDGVEFSKPEPV